MIRPAKIDDVPTIARLIRALAQYEKLEHTLTLDEAQMREHLFGAKPAAEVLLAGDAGRVVGFALFFATFSTFVGKPGIWLEDLFVEPEFRGRGHGKALFLAVAKHAVERDCGRMEWSVLTWNAPSIAFYESMGAKALDDWHTYRLAGDGLDRLAYV
jgi:GNAT superfamily N-acetyltransferase